MIRCILWTRGAVIQTAWRWLHRYCHYCHIFRGGVISNFSRRLFSLPLYLAWWLKRPRLGFLSDRRRSPFTLIRYFMYQHLVEVLASHVVQGRILSVSGSGPIVDMLAGSASKVVKTSYPEIDIQALPFSDASFDAVVADQVLEHVRNPFKAINESTRVLRPGGMLIYTTCFLNPVHCYPIDWWRFSPDALRGMVDGLEVIDCGGWGNRSALLFVFMGLRNHLIPLHPDHPLHRIAVHNDPEYPITT